jgi:hypothetical protein
MRGAGLMIRKYGRLKSWIKNANQIANLKNLIVYKGLKQKIAFCKLYAGLATV